MACPSGGTASVPVRLVEDGWNMWSGYAQTILTAALASVQDISNYTVGNAGLPDITLDPELSVPRQYAIPNEIVASDIEFDVPEAPNLEALTQVTTTGFPTAPTFTVAAPILTYPATPQALDVIAPAEPQDADDRTVPSAPSLTYPNVPSLRALTLPAAADLDLPTLSAIGPSIGGLTAPTGDFTYEDQDFTNDLLDELTAKLRAWLEGGTGLPATVIEQIWERGRSRERSSALGAKQTAMDGWASRGFTLHGGAINAQLREIEEKTWEAENALSREVQINEAELEQKNIHFAIERGITLVEFLGNLHNQTMQRAFAIAQYVFGAQIEIFNARLELYKAQVQGYQIEVTAWKTILEGELGKLEIYKAKLDGQKLIGELNLQDVEIYKARLQGVLTQAEVFKSEVTAAKTQIEADSLKIESYKAKIAAYGEKVKAHLGQVQLYSAQLEGEQVKTDIYQTQANVFASLTQAYSTGVAAVRSQKEIELKKNEELFKKLDAEVRLWEQQLKVEERTVQHTFDIQKFNLDKYRTDSEVERTRVTSDVERYRLAMTEAQHNITNNIEKAKLEIEQIMRASGLELESMKTVAAVYGQLEAAALSAVNLSATTQAADQSSYNYSYQC